MYISSSIFLTTDNTKLKKKEFKHRINNPEKKVD